MTPNISSFWNRSRQSVDVKDSRDTGKPDYQRLRKMFSKLSSRQGFEYDNVFDWTIRGFERLELNKETSNDVDAN
ncbi:hypothetical protein LTR21_003495 [Exophiala xenobiotica]|nr:hypothetical protein LTR21_003495 [Exophiala xenobiotica]